MFKAGLSWCLYEYALFSKRLLIETVGSICFVLGGCVITSGISFTKHMIERCCSTVGYDGYDSRV